eukprot:Hpha_TRINITY_DN26610_c0_g1::TRINITY_DN26610_c0_g1_i1::g.86025::m.86025
MGEAERGRMELSLRATSPVSPSISRRFDSSSIPGRVGSLETSRARDVDDATAELSLEALQARRRREEATAAADALLCRLRSSAAAATEHWASVSDRVQAADALVQELPLGGRRRVSTLRPPSQVHSSAVSAELDRLLRRGKDGDAGQVSCSSRYDGVEVP